MMDPLTIEAAEAAVHAGLSRGARRGADRRARRRRARRSTRTLAARRARSAASTARSRSRVARRRRRARAALEGPQGGVRGDGPRSSPNYYVQDGVVPRTKLPEVLRRIGELSARARPARRQRLPRRRRQPAPARALRRARRRARRSAREELAEAILDACIDAGGSITGEHGVGVDKACSMPLMFGERRPRGDAAAAPRVRPGRAREPGQGLPDAAALRRGARARTARIRSSGPALPSVSEPRAGSPSCCGGGRRGGAIDRGAATSLSTRRLDRVLEHEPGDLTCIVEAGIRLSALAGSARAGTGSGSRSTRPATRRSAPASPAISRARCATASARCATS